MKEVFFDTVKDSLKLIPFLFVVFLIMEYIEHKMSSKSKQIIQKSGKLGPLIGAFVGVLPQCGFSVAATNLYAARIISVGTLVSVYLSTSDEMLPILISEKANLSLILKAIGLKILIGIVSGFIIDFILRKKEKENIHKICENDHCSCKDGIIKASIHHTLNIFIFIIVASFFLNMLIFYVGKENIGNIFLKDSFYSPFISSLIGLIPNCGASVIITELYVNNAISFASLIAGLLTGSGVALLVLFKENKNIKQNILILCTMYGIGAIMGVIIEMVGMIL